MGVLFVLLVEKLGEYLQTNNSFSNKERFVTSMLWPLGVVLLIISFIKEAINPKK